MIGAVDAKFAETAEGDTLNHMNLRNSQFSQAASLLGKSAEDRNCAVWLATSTISEDVGHPKQIALALLIQNRLLQGLINLNLAERVKAMEMLL
jgi:hypothetical protein